MVRRWAVAGLVVSAACNDTPVEASGSTGAGTTDASTQGTATSSTSSSNGSSATTTADSTSTQGPTSDASDTATTTTDTAMTTGDGTTHGGTTGVATTGSTDTSTSTGDSSSTSTTATTTDGTTEATSHASSDGGPMLLDVGVEPGCGNGVLEDGEVCDDGDLIGGDGCEADCTSSDDVQPIWTLEQGGPFGFADCGGGVAFDSEDNLILAGLWEDQIWVGKYDLDYEQVWEVTYPAVSGVAGCLEVRVAVDAADNVAVIGPQDSATIYDVFVAKLGSDGAEQWTATFAGQSPQTDNAGDISFDLDGNVLVTGDLTDAETNRSFWVAKLDPEGVLLWSDEHLGAGCCINGGRGIAADAEANVWTAGYESPQMFETDIFMRRYDPDGTVLATDVILGVDDASQDLAYGIALDEFGDRIVVGTSRVDTGIDDNDAWVRRYEGDVEQWMTPFEGTGTAEDYALGVALAPDGTIVVSGFMFDSPADGLRNRWLAKLAADGTSIWQRRHLDESPDEGWRGTAVASDGRIAVAGVASFAFPAMAEARYAVYQP